ncbi:MAG TPA: GNAT family N-acetyltransferase [Thermomicrobiales bacterium]|jgi:GNAT superfamily N-acetyltransferase
MTNGLNQLTLRHELQPGDLGWVIGRHGERYWQEYGWDAQFEALVAGIVAGFAANYDAERERCWIAELGGEQVGCIFLVKASDTTGKLRLFLVEPLARGQGIGKLLVNECIRFARTAGYSTITLWTVDILRAARHLYEQNGFRLIHSETNRNFGHDLVDQTWELTL